MPTPIYPDKPALCRGPDRGGAAQHRERRLAAQPAGVVAGGGQQRAGCVLADPGQRHQLGRRLGGEPVQLGGERGDLGRQGLVAPGKGAQREHGRGQGAGDPARVEAGRGAHQRSGRQAPELLAELGGGGDQQRFERVDRLGAGPHRACAGDPQRADHLHLPVARLGHDRHLPSLDRAGGGLGVDRVGLAVAAAGGAVGAVDLQHGLALGGKEAGQGGAVGAGALYAPGVDLAEPPRPGEQVLVAGGGGGDADGGHAAAELVLGVGDMDVEVGVDPDGELPGCGVCHAGDGRLLSFAGRGVARAPAGRTALRWVWATGSYQVTSVRLACLWWSRLEPTGQATGTRPVVRRVRLSPRPPPR